jgi:DNA-binding beta-propeller fold protein YncE
MGITVALLSGCAVAPVEMVYFPEDRAPERPLVWPGPPEMPRLAYAGELIGEDNFRTVEGERDGAALRVLRWIAGIGRDKDVRELIRPQSGMVDASGRILVTDAGREAVVVFDESAGKLTFWQEAEPGRSFLSPVGIAADGNGGYLVADADIGYVVRLNADGNPTGSIGAGLLKRPTGMCRSETSGDIFVADSAAHDIKVFDTSGLLQRSIGGRGTEAGRFNGPTHLSCSGDKLYVTDTLNARVQVLSLSGEPKARIGQRGLFVGNLVRPKGVVTDRDGHVYIIESYYDHLLVFGNDGELLLPIGGSGSGAGQFFLPAGAWTDNGSRLFVADMFNGRVVVLDYLGGGS